MNRQRYEAQHHPWLIVQETLQHKANNRTEQENLRCPACLCNLLDLTAASVETTEFLREILGDHVRPRRSLDLTLAAPQSIENPSEDLRLGHSYWSLRLWIKNETSLADHVHGSC